MLYIIAGIFLLFSLINLYKSKDLKIRPRLIGMDYISLGLIWLVFIIFALVTKADFVNTLIIAAVSSVYVLSARVSRGLSEDYLILQTGAFFLNRKYSYGQIKQVNVSNDGKYVVFAIVSRNNAVGTQRYPIEKKDELIKIFKTKNIPIIYK